jgi:FKBP-type peptidyl-prolyl cis-trans isomerase
MNTKYLLSPLFFAFAAMLIVSSCAKDVAESADSIEKKVLDAHIKVVYNDTITPLSTGVYVITNKKGTGRQIKDGSSFFVRYSTLDLKNNYITTNRDDIAKQVGGFSYANYYGPVLFEMSNYTLVRGLEEAFRTLREGSVVRIILPSWATDFGYKNSDRYHATTTVYDVEVVKVIDDYPQYELDTLQRFSNKYYDGIDSLFRGYYYYSLKQGTGDSLKVGTTVKYNYVGKLLNGFVFDTNIEDTARKYRIYSSDNPSKYNPLSLELHEVGKTGSSGSSVVDGFASVCTCCEVSVSFRGTGR